MFNCFTKEKLYNVVAIIIQKLSKSNNPPTAKKFDSERLKPGESEKICILKVK